MSRLHVQPRKFRTGKHILGWAGHAQVEMARRRSAAKVARRSRQANR